LRQSRRDAARTLVLHLDSQEVIGIEAILLRAKRALVFDAETGFIPCRHDELVVDFAQSSGGQFAPTSVAEQWHEKADAEGEGDYTLQFIFGPKLYRARCAILGTGTTLRELLQRLIKP
jgi:hypothetical protein